MARSATRTSFAGRTSHGVKTDHALTFNPDHPMGAGQLHLVLNAVFVYEALVLSELIYESPIMRWFVLHWPILS